MKSIPILKAPDRVFIPQNSVKVYHHQLAEKKTYLSKAKKIHIKSAKLIDALKQKISILTEELRSMNDDLIHCEERGKSTEELRLKKETYEHLINSALEKLDPYILRLHQLANNINHLEEDIRRIITEVHP